MIVYLHTFIWFQVFLSYYNNLYTIIYTLFLFYNNHLSAQSYRFKYSNLIQLIFKHLFDPSMGPWHTLSLPAGVDFKVMAVMGSSTFPRVPKLESLDQMKCHIQGAPHSSSFFKRYSHSILNLTNKVALISIRNKKQIYDEVLVRSLKLSDNKPDHYLND